MTIQNPDNEKETDDNKDPVLESLMQQIKSNYIENVEIDDLIEFDKNKSQPKSSFDFKKISQLLQENRKIVITAVLTALFTLIVTLGLTGLFGSFSFFASGTNAVAQKAGIALSEAELKSAVARLGSDVYWVGPLKDAKYALDVNEAGATFVRYLPNGEGIDDPTKKYLIVATYRVNAAYDAVRAAGNEQDGIGLMTADGAAVYYNKNASTNVYMAFPGQDFQIEVFDPSPGRALQLVNTSGLVRPIN